MSKNVNQNFGDAASDSELSVTHNGHKRVWYTRVLEHTYDMQQLLSQNNLQVSTLIPFTKAVNEIDDYMKDDVGVVVVCLSVETDLDKFANNIGVGCRFTGLSYPLPEHAKVTKVERNSADFMSLQLVPESVSESVLSFFTTCFVFPAKSIPGDAYSFLSEHNAKFEDILCMEPSANYLWFLDTAKVDLLFAPHRFTNFQELLPLLRAIDTIKGFISFLDDVLMHICKSNDDLHEFWYFFVMYNVHKSDRLFTGTDTECNCLKWLGWEQLDRVMATFAATGRPTANNLPTYGESDHMRLFLKGHVECLAAVTRPTAKPLDACSVRYFLENAKWYAEQLSLLRNCKKRQRSP